MNHFLVSVRVALCFVATGMTPASQQVIAQDTMQSMTQFTIDSPPGQYVHNGIQQMHINCSGQGNITVVLESGLGSTSLDWALVQNRIAKQTRVCSYDRSGYGWSDRSASVRVVPTMARDLDKLLLMAGEKPPYLLVGHSFGGLIAQYFAHEFTEKTAGVVLVDSTHPNQFSVFDEAGIPVPQAPKGERFFIRNFDSVPDALPANLKPIAAQLAAQRKSVEALYNELRTLRGNANLVKSKITVPLPVKTRVISRSDRIQPNATKNKILLEAVWQELQQDLAKRNQTELTVAATNDHFVHLSEPETVARIILEAAGAVK